MMQRVAFFLILSFLYSTSVAIADDSPLFHQCLRGSSDPELRAKSKAACTKYLQNLMKDVRLGTVTRADWDKPFCIPDGDLPDDQFGALEKRIEADNPEIPDYMRGPIAIAVINRAYRCQESN